jgi:uncharacterized membrane protein YccF (DUF307 family)
MAGTGARIIWFCLVGWWLGLLWICSALIIMCTVVGFPIGVYMLIKTGDVMLLKSDPRTVVINARGEQ